MQPAQPVEVQNVVFSEYSVSISQLINENTEAADMENAGHPSSETPTATNYFLQYISSRYVCQALCPASEVLRSFIHLVSDSSLGGRMEGREQNPPEFQLPPSPFLLSHLVQLWRSQDSEL